MKILGLPIILLSILIISGCTAIPPIDFTVQDVGMVTNRKAAELKSLTVGFAPQTQQGIIEANAGIPPIWKEGLQDALNRSLIFQDDVSIKVNLTVRIVEFDTPQMGLEMVTKVGAIYEVVNRKNGDMLFAELIESEGIVATDYAFVGVVRAVESMNRAVRNNIAIFINRLQNTDFAKPMFEG